VEGQVNHYLQDGTVTRRHGTASNVITPYQVFDTADAPFCLAAGNDRLWVRAAKVMGHPEWGDDPRFCTGRLRNKHRPELVGLIAGVLRTRSRAEWLAGFEAAGVPVSPVNDIGELARSEQMAAVDLLRTLPDNGLTMVGLPISFDRERPHFTRGAPGLGEHNAEILGTE
jgi:crotonobetainyl-CoA:carnitine CoA-transferase CaiB-like acyl-CoA transferase